MFPNVLLGARSPSILIPNIQIFLFQALGRQQADLSSGGHLQRPGSGARNVREGNKRVAHTFDCAAMGAVQSHIHFRLTYPCVTAR